MVLIDCKRKTFLSLCLQTFLELLICGLVVLEITDRQWSILNKLYIELTVNISERLNDSSFFVKFTGILIRMLASKQFILFLRFRLKEVCR